MKFTKMHGAGNDFVVLDFTHRPFDLDSGSIRAIADRHRGIGADQILVVEKPRQAGVDFRYRIFNADGGEVEQCGNGVRCLASFLAPRAGPELTLVGPAGSTFAKVVSAERVSVDLGEPSFDPKALPFTAPERRDRYRLQLPDQSVEFGAVSMGNPHIVIPVDSVERAPVGILGPVLERHRSFPQRVNVGFMQRVDERHIELRVFERGVGETLACGTGAAAAVAVGRLWGELADEVEVSLPGGKLMVSWHGPGSTLWQTGPTSAVYEGQIDL
jgi:diaminopimelate epimerase